MVTPFGAWWGPPGAIAKIYLWLYMHITTDHALLMIRNSWVSIPNGKLFWWKRSSLKYTNKMFWNGLLLKEKSKLWNIYFAFMTKKKSLFYLFPLFFIFQYWKLQTNESCETFHNILILLGQSDWFKKSSS